MKVGLNGETAEISCYVAAEGDGFFFSCGDLMTGRL